MSVLTPTLCMNGRESAVLTFWVGLTSPEVHAKMHGSMKKHPSHQSGEMRKCFKCKWELSLSMWGLLNLELHEPTLVECNTEIQYKIVFGYQIL